MKKLSELLLEEQRTLDIKTTPSLPNPTLVLFDNVLDPKKVLQSPEIGLLVKYCFGEAALSFTLVGDPDKLHDWFREEQYKALAQGCSKIYPFKTRLDDLTLDNHSDQFFGPLNAHLFSPNETVYDVLTITCRWNDGLFTNDYYVIGVIADTEDLEKVKNQF